MTRQTPAGSGPDRISLSRIKRDMQEVSYLSDELVISALGAEAPALQHALQLEGFAAVVMLGGEATLSVDHTPYTIRPNDIVVISPGVTAELVRSSDDAAAQMIAFSKSFVEGVQIDLATAMPVYMRFGQDPVLHLGEQDLAELRQLFQLIKTLLRSDKERYRHEIIRSLFTAAFYIITELNRRQSEDSGPQGRPEVIFREFTALLHQHSQHERSVAFYAGRMKLSAKYLSEVVKHVSGRTAAQWIDASVILEAKTLLRYSGLSIQEIAYRLNFSSQSFFGKYFRHHTGVSPSRYRRRA